MQILLKRRFFLLRRSNRLVEKIEKMNFRAVGTIRFILVAYTYGMPNLLFFIFRHISF